MPIYTFTEQDFRAACNNWGCNCGPTALAFALQTSLDAVHRAIPNFDERRYTSPSMMRAALDYLGQLITVVRNPHCGRDYVSGTYNMFAWPMSLVRIQWTGPWTANGKTAKWAARQTHWIACWTERGDRLVFDCNGGMMRFDRWEKEIVPAIVATIDRADGGWFPANVWRLIG